MQCDTFINQKSKVKIVFTFVRIIYNYPKNRKRKAGENDIVE